MVIQVLDFTCCEIIVGSRMRIGIDISGMSVKIGLVEGQGIVSRDVKVMVF